MQFRTASDSALLVEFDRLDEAVRAQTAWRNVAGVLDVVGGARTVLVRYDRSLSTARGLTNRLREIDGGTEATGSERDVEIAVHYDGEDLSDVAEILGVTIEHLVRRHVAAQWRVAFAGFAPGFGYLVGDDPVFDVPRRSTPRTRVPAGAVALAGAFTGVYPRESPGGWQIIGRTDAALWDLDREPPALLTPGARVRFVRAARESLRAEQSPTRPAAAQPDAAATGARIEVAETVLPLLVQDPGRIGHASLGVSASGAADRIAAAQANRAVGNDRRAVGNDRRAAVIESVGACVLRFASPRGGEVAAVSGATAALALVDAGGCSRDVPPDRPFAVADGDELHIAGPSRGVRCYVAVRGGFRVDPVLGSRATDTLAGLGPAPLHRGSSIGLGAARDVRSAVETGLAPRPLPAVGDTTVLTVTPGPRDDWFDHDALDLLAAQRWEVTPRSDRIGLRLSGARPLSRRIDAELPSEGVVRGALQVPPSGQPVLFLPDHPLTGGYPVIAAVIDRDLDLAGQLPSGSFVRFRLAAPPR